MQYISTAMTVTLITLIVCQIDMSSANALQGSVNLNFSCVDFKTFCVIAGVTFYVCGVDPVLRSAMRDQDMTAAYKAMKSSKVWSCLLK